jgi:hypothetical protein
VFRVTTCSQSSAVDNHFPVVQAGASILYVCMACRHGVEGDKGDEGDEGAKGARSAVSASRVSRVSRVPTRCYGCRRGVEVVDDVKWC